MELLRSHPEQLILQFQMRNTTKLKKVLEEYDCEFSMQQGVIKLFMTNKSSIQQPVTKFEHASYTRLIQMAYAYYLKQQKGAED